MAPSDDRLDQSLSQLGAVLFTRTQLDELLHLTASLGRESIGGARSVSVSLLHEGRFTTPASSDEGAVRVDAVQYEGNGGPCVEAAREGRRVDVCDEAGWSRWPEVHREARKQGLGSVMSLPLTADGSTIGALNVYSDRPKGFDPAEIERGSKFARVASVVLANAEAFATREAMAAQLREALETRDIIGQAKGILMERETISGEQAFDVLRRASQATNVKLRELASRYVAIAEEAAARGRAS
jgi:GAF domain-containing protein